MQGFSYESNYGLLFTVVMRWKEKEWQGLLTNKCKILLKGIGPNQLPKIFLLLIIF